MANADSTIQDDVIDDLHNRICAVSSILWMLSLVPKHWDEIPVQAAQEACYAASREVELIQEQVNKLCHSNAELRNKLTAATQFVAMAHKEGVDHG